MINIDEQLKQLPPEFIVEMEKQKKDRWEDIFEYLVNYFQIKEDIEKTEAEGFPIVDFFKKIHDFGFYGGVNFALDPQSPYEKKSST